MSAVPWCDAGVECRFTPDAVATLFKARSGPLPKPEHCHLLANHLNHLATIRLVDGKLPNTRGRPDGLREALDRVRRRVEQCERDLSLSLGGLASEGPMGADLRELQGALRRVEHLLADYDHILGPPMPSQAMAWHCVAAWTAVYAARAWRSAGRVDLLISSRNSPLVTVVVAALAEIEGDVRDGNTVAKALAAAKNFILDDLIVPKVVTRI